MSSLAAATREAVDAHPFVRDGLRAGVVNFSAAARFLDVEGGDEAIATALRRYAEELPEIESRDGSVRVTMQSGIGSGDGSVLAVGGISFAADAGSLTAIQAHGDVDARLLATVATRLADASVGVEGVGLTGSSLVVVVERRDGTTALTIVEDAADGFR
ncbi:Uncharacterized protein HSRCO_1639 [Halanaeroarchaeum sp. HSR-CO]|uniref:DUF7523 family protein n=1 Tax=Halanaeroarchaeum sp. HSR-CO TaxID=2866382 RepID=UPI00217ECDAA|nr:hypothetical protein [Halanaeroarchaeum sp. HSR-CO]UWG47918.1 Uncharacterized protein HSRCO_1639 [Halanaeroarchaeum sp. HSR-CO]